MAITHVGSVTASAGGTTTLTPTLPTHATDDLLVAYMFSDSQPTSAVHTLATASGWTQLIVSEENTDGRDTAQSLWYKVATSASETSPTFEINASNAHTVVIHVFRGVDTTTPIDVTTTTNGGQNNTTAAAPAITTATNNAAVVVFGGQSHDDLTAYGAPSGYTAGEFDDVGAGSHWAFAYSAYLLDAGTAGTETPGAWTHTDNGSAVADYQNLTVALRPDAGGGTPAAAFQYYNGSAWADSVVKYYDGSAWQTPGTGKLKYYNGSSWVALN